MVTFFVDELMGLKEAKTNNKRTPKRPMQANTNKRRE